jgi:MFS family permease
VSSRLRANGVCFSRAWRRRPVSIERLPECVSAADASDALGMSAAGLGWLFALHTVTTLAIRPLMGAVSDRTGRRLLIVAGLTVCSLAVWWLSEVESIAALGIAVFAYAAGVAVTTAATSAYITDVAPRARYRAAHGVFGTIYEVGDAAARSSRDSSSRHGATGRCSGRWRSQPGRWLSFSIGLHGKGFDPWRWLLEGVRQCDTRYSSSL